MRPMALPVASFMRLPRSSRVNQVTRRPRSMAACPSASMKSSVAVPLATFEDTKALAKEETGGSGHPAYPRATGDCQSEPELPQVNCGLPGFQDHCLPGVSLTAGYRAVSPVPYARGSCGLAK